MRVKGQLKIRAMNVLNSTVPKLIIRVLATAVSVEELVKRSIMETFSKLKNVFPTSTPNGYTHIMKRKTRAMPRMSICIIQT